jgi:diguanylate cyclase (GGDEF)-like protein
MGLFVYAAIAWTDDYRLHFVAAVLTAGYSAGSVGLNAAVQAGFPASLFASAIPAAIALAERDEPIYRMMSVATILYIVALRMTSKSIHDQMVSSLKSGAEKAQLLLAITEKSERFDSALSNMPQGLAMVDADCRVVVINKKLHELLGLPTIEDNIRIDALFELSARKEVLPPASIRDLNRRVRDSAHNETQKEIKIDTISGETLEITFQPMSRGGSVVIVTDVTEKKALDRFTHLAHHDTLTGLPNRMFFEKRFAATLVAAEQGDERIAVIALDLDHFKAVNDTLGHQVGDELLKAVAKRIQGRLRADDFVSRIGGDEFMLIHVGASSDSAEKLARRMIEVVSAPYDIEGKEIVIGLTAGIAHFPEDGAGAAELLRNADIALYQGKNAGRGVLHLFERRTAGEAGHRKAV